MRRPRARWLVAAALLLVVLALAAPRVARAWWWAKSSNPVRRGVLLAADLGCFHCHGELGRDGIVDPGQDAAAVPAWSGGVWMMYLDSEEEIRQYILDGVSQKRAEDGTAVAQRERQAVRMPAYRDVLSGSDLDDLVAAFRVLSGMSVTPAGSAARRGHELATRWRCFSCHGVAASGGRPNPGSFTGFIPGWYGADFDDLVRDRSEFDEWIREGAIDRLESNPLARYFVTRQRIAMPRYPDLTREELDDLQAYAEWLAETGGGRRGDSPW